MKILRLSGINLDLDETEDNLPAKAAAALSITAGEIAQLDIIKKAIDARRHKPPHFVYVIKISVADNLLIPDKLEGGIQLEEIEDRQSQPQFTKISAPELPAVIAGSGPAGLFAAYLLAKRGLSVLLLERGTSIEKRTKDVQTFWEKGILNPASNVLFGEGGAGTFSDGKLTSRSKNPHATWVKQVLVEMGAPREIITDAKPHVGTDKLRNVVINLRNHLIELGCEVRFEAQVTDFINRQGRLEALIINEKEEIKTKNLILAIGQSADDTYERLSACGIKMEAKPFAMGLRIEHPQELINSIQYGKWSRHQQLPPAEYFVTAAVPILNRSVYSFCMCPGGSIIGCSAFPGYVLTNGMSNSQRDGKFANSALVVNVRIDDFAGSGEPLAGLTFRRHWERQAFESGGSNYSAPAQKLMDFLEKKPASSIGITSFHPGVNPCALQDTLPEFIVDALRLGIREFNRKMPGFITEDAHLIGVETRTSSPVRICRRGDGQSENVQGVYPCGEGAGYAGGIISSALDGIRAAENLITNLD